LFAWGYFSFSLVSTSQYCELHLKPQQSESSDQN